MSGHSIGVELTEENRVKVGVTCPDPDVHVGALVAGASVSDGHQRDRKSGALICARVHRAPLGPCGRGADDLIKRYGHRIDLDTDIDQLPSHREAFETDQWRWSGKSQAASTNTGRATQAD